MPGLWNTVSHRPQHGQTGSILYPLFQRKWMVWGRTTNRIPQNTLRTVAPLLAVPDHAKLKTHNPLFRISLALGWKSSSGSSGYCSFLWTERSKKLLSEVCGEQLLNWGGRLCDLELELTAGFQRGGALEIPARLLRPQE
eukprot:2757678-Pyramimonas_sp.AAC.1